ncbi:MAG TPA: hypothetical protein VI583_18245 [Cyclobacteriaceae bacterium]|nr:hypothetical protein [Cyclobacteriaceae bacterium]
MLIEIWLLIIKYYYAAAILVSILIVVLTVSVIMKWNLLYKPYIPVLLKITPSSITVGKKKFPMRDVRLEEIRQKLEC